jgi:hypothetical protein
MSIIPNSAPFPKADIIPKTLSSEAYFTKVLGMISALGKGAELGIIDIQQAFRMLIVNPADFDHLGIKFEDKYWIDKNLPMGCAISGSLLGIFHLTKCFYKIIDFTTLRKKQMSYKTPTTI